jgi:hypothetical protein
MALYSQTAWRNASRTNLGISPTLPLVRAGVLAHTHLAPTQWGEIIIAPQHGGGSNSNKDIALNEVIESSNTPTRARRSDFEVEGGGGGNV